MRTHKSLVALGSAVVLSACSVGAFSPAYAATGAPGPLTLTAQGSNTAGGTVTLTAKESASTPLWYQWWVQEPNGQWKQVQEGSQSTYQLTNLSAGSYLVSVDTLTTAQAKSHDWSAEQKAEQTVNVGTTVAVTNITGALTSTGVTAGQPVTVTAQATNITNPQYQFWIDQNGTWTGTAYTDRPTYTFTPTTANFEVAVYAKTLLEPNNGGSGVGLTTTTATTPQMWAQAQVQTQAEKAVLAALPAAYQATDGVVSASMVNAPSPSVIDALPSVEALPANGTITGVKTQMAANPSLLSQAQSIAAAQGVTITASMVEQGMDAAAQAAMDFFGDDPLSYMSVQPPINNTVASEMATLSGIIPAYTNASTGMIPLHSYTYRQSVAVEQNLTTQDLTKDLSVSEITTANSSEFPARVLSMTVPRQETLVQNYASASQPDNTVLEYTVNIDAKVSLVSDPLAKDGTQWMTGALYYTFGATPLVLWK